MPIFRKDKEIKQMIMKEAHSSLALNIKKEDMSVFNSAQLLANLFEKTKHSWMQKDKNKSDRNLVGK